MGKTYVAAGLIAKLRLRTLYIVPKIPLATQAVRDLGTCFYSDESTEQLAVGLYSKSVKAPKVRSSKTKESLVEQGVTVIVINTAITRPIEFFARYDFIILDEAHSYCSPQRRSIFRKATGRAVLGMSATTEDRRDGFDAILVKELAFDGVIHADRVPGFTYDDVSFNCEAKVLNYSGPPEHTQNLRHESTGMIFVHYMHNQYIGDPYRTRLAVGELVNLYDWRGPNEEQHSIYVFAEEIDILEQAKAAFTRELLDRSRADILAATCAPELGLEMFVGGLKTTKVEEISESGRVLFSTYSYAGTGISITRMTCVLLLTPRMAGMKQILARVLRRGSDTNIPRVVVDIVDRKTALKHQVGQRKLAYEHYGFAVKETSVKYQEIP